LKGVNANNRLANDNQVFVQRNNAIIYAKSGETVNISCSFDPNLVAANNNKLRNAIINSDSDANAYNYKNKRKKRRKRHNKRDTSKRHQIFSGYSYNSDQHLNGIVNKPGNDQLDYTIEETDFPSMQLKNQNNFDLTDNLDDESTSIFTFNENNNYDKSISTDNKYEIDWYFLDRKGHMNIIR
jgi:hypothetical protein